MKLRCNGIKVGATRKGKTLAAALQAVTSRDEAVVIFDPHENSLAKEVLTHGDETHILYDRLSDVKHALSYDLLVPSTNPD